MTTQNVFSVGDHPNPPRPLGKKRPNQRNTAMMAAKQHWVADRVFYVLRGLPGDGLEDKAREIAEFAIREGVNSVAICKSEDFLRNPDGSYRFDKDSFVDAHRRNFERIVQYAVIGTEVIILANPNIKHAHYQHYVKTLNNFYYRIESLVIGNPYDLTEERARELSRKTTTKVPIDKLLQYSGDFEPED